MEGSTVGPEVTEFRIGIPETDLTSLRDRLRSTRWPEPETVTDWSQGVPLSYLQDLCRYWADEGATGGQASSPASASKTPAMYRGSC